MPDLCAAAVAAYGRDAGDRGHRQRLHRICLGGSGVVLLLFLNNAIFRGAGDAAIAMRLLWVSNIINLMLDPCLIFGWGPFPRLGVTGAALATFSGRSIGVLYQFYRLMKGTERIRVLARQIRVHFDVLWRLVRVSLTGILQFAIAHTSWIGLVRIVSTFGAAALAGYTIAIRIVIFVILPSWGLSNAAATLVGQNLGAGKPDRAERAVWRTGLYNMIFLGSVGVFFALFAEPVVRIFISDPAVVPLGTACLRIVSYGNIGYAYCHGDDAGVQRRWGYDHADNREPFWLLAIRDSVGLCIGNAAGHEIEWSFLFHCNCRVVHGGRQRDPVQAREMEEAEDLKLLPGTCQH